MVKIVASDPEYYKYEVTLTNGERVFVELYGYGGDKDAYQFIDKYPQFFSWSQDENMPLLTSDEGLTMKVLKDASDMSVSESVVIRNTDDKEIYPTRE